MSKVVWTPEDGWTDNGPEVEVDTSEPGVFKVLHKVADKTDNDVDNKVVDSVEKAWYATLGQTVEEVGL